MTIREAFRNRGLLATERTPVYRVRYGHSKYDCSEAVFPTNEPWEVSKTQNRLARAWEAYAAEYHIRPDSVLEIHCIANSMEEWRKQQQFCTR